MPFKSTKERFEELAKKKREESENSNKKSVQKDNSSRFSPTVGKGKQKENYIVRILPNIFVNEGLDEPYFEFKAHLPATASGKKGYAVCPWYFNKEVKCPLCAESRKYWKKVNDNIASPSDEARARNFGSVSRYVANILVVSDPRTGEENQTGKVLVWEFGIQVYDKLKEAWSQGINFYDVNEGFNFNVVIKMKGSNPNYEGSFFSREPSAISTKTAELEKIHSQIVDIIGKTKERIASIEYLNKLLNGESSDAGESNSKPSSSNKETSDKLIEGRTFMSEPSVPSENNDEIDDVISQTDADNSHTNQEPESIDFTDIDGLFDESK